MIDWIVEPWTWGAWMGRGLAAALLVAVPCAVLGVYLYLLRLSMLADALAHVALPGILVGFFVTGGLSPGAMLLGALASGVFATWSIEAVRAIPSVRPDAAIGIVFTALFGAGVIVVSTAVRDAHIDTQCVLFGNLLGVSDASLTLLSILAPLVLFVAWLGRRWLAAAALDEAWARTAGVPVRAVYYGLMAAVATTTVAGFEAVGVILVMALIVVPAATAHLLAERMGAMVFVAVIHAVVAATGGLYASVWFDASPAGAIVLAGGLLYGLAWVAAPRHGAIARHRAALAGRM